MLSLDEARQVIASRVHMLPPERVALGAARGRVLREGVAATEDMPAFDRSAFDGFAVSAGSSPGRLSVAFEIATGAQPPRALGSGECARIFTGAAMPAGADAVVMQEHCQREGGDVEIPPTRSGQGVRRRGEDARAGDLLIEAGTTLRALGLTILAQLGHATPLVASRPRILHVVTGGELVPVDASPAPGQIRDSNSTLVAALAAGAGCEIAGHRHAGDDLGALLGAIGSVPESDWHCLLISGGASVGDYDFGARALGELGFSVHFQSLNLRPGKPLIFATRGRQLAFVIPGNPLSHFVCWHVAIRAAIDVLATGGTSLELATVSLGGDKPLPGNPRETWWPARLAVRNGTAIAEPLKWQSSGDLTGLANLGALVRVPSNSAPVSPGELVAALIL
jgi:molybdopterin molybdotransferase